MPVSKEILLNTKLPIDVKFSGMVMPVSDSVYHAIVDRIIQVKCCGWPEWYTPINIRLSRSRELDNQRYSCFFGFRKSLGASSDGFDSSEAFPTWKIRTRFRSRGNHLLLQPFDNLE